MGEFRDLYIIGAGGFGREAAWLAERINMVEHTWNIKGFIDEDTGLHGKIVGGYPVCGGAGYLERLEPGVWAVIAVGDPKARRQCAERLSGIRGVSFATLADPGVEMSGRVSVGEGSILCAGTVLTVDVKIGRHNILNLGCTVGHDAELHDFVTLCPSVNISGNVEVGECAEIGTGAQVIQGISVGKGAIIGAGAVVVKDIEAEVTAVGCPAGVVKRHPDERLGGYRPS